MRIILQPFRGEIPRRSPELLPDNNATVARNCRLYSGEIRPYGGLRGVSDAYEGSGVDTLYRFGGVANSEISGVITNTTQADPVVVTCADHGLSNDDKIYIEGLNGGGAGHNLNDADYLVTVLTSNTFSLQFLDGTDVDGAGHTAFSSNGYFTHQDGYWFTTDTGVRADFVRGPINNDSTERTYYTLSNAAPRMTYSTIAETGALTNPYPQDSLLLGIPAPTNAPSVSQIPVQPRFAFITDIDIDADDRVVVTFADTATHTDGHSFTSGDLITFTEPGQTEVNGNTYEAEAVDNNVVILRDSSTGAYIDGGAWGSFTGSGSGFATQEPNPDPPTADQAENWSYVYTYVSSLGEEGPPSPPADIVVFDYQQANITMGGTGPAGDYDFDAKRLYRSNESEYFFVDEVDISYTNVFQDQSRTSQLGEVIPSTLWDPPPSDMTSLIALPNGVMAGVSANRVCMSEPNVPHAWPATYQQVGNYDFVGCSNFDTTIVAATAEDAYLINGATPDAATMEALEIRQGAVSEKSFVSLGNYGVMYASPDGLVAVTRDGVRIATEPFFKRNDWQALSPETIDGYLYEDYYVGFFNDGTERAFLFNPRDPNEGFIFLGIYATAAYYDHLDDALYMWQTTNTPECIAKFDDVLHADNLTYRWRSKTYDAPELVSFTCGEVHAASYSDLTLRVYADDTLVHTQTVTSAEPFRITNYSPARSHQIEVEGTDNVKRIVVAEAFEEIP